MASTENLLWYTGGYKLGHDNSVKLNTFLSYYKWPWYWHEWIDKEIPIDPDPSGKPENPCDKCKENQECKDGKCYDIPPWTPECDDQNPCKAPKICVNWHCVDDDTGEDKTDPKDQTWVVSITDPCDLSNFDPIYSVPIKTNTWVWGSIDLWNWYTTWVDAYSWERWYYNPLYYHYVKIEWRLNALNNENRLDYWFWNSEWEPDTYWCVSIATAHIDWSDAVDWADRFRIELYSNWDFVISVSRYKEPWKAYDWTILKQWNVNWIWDASPTWDLDYTLPVGMVVGVMWWAYITSLTTKHTKVITNTYNPWTSNEVSIVHNWTNGTIRFSRASDWRSVTIKDTNLWATEYYEYWDTVTDAHLWKMYQWWNNYWFAPTWALEKTSNIQVDASSYWPSEYSNDTYRTWNNDWSTTPNNDLWWWVTWDEEARIWPCPKWWHIPTVEEFMIIEDVFYKMSNAHRWNNYWTNWFPSPAKYRDINWNLAWYSYMYYWTVTEDNDWQPRTIEISWLNWAVAWYWQRWYWMFIRPFKNNATEYTIRFLNYDWTVLQRSRVAAWNTPEYTWSTPTKPGDQQYVYTFDWWDSPIVAATENKDYTATYVEKTILYSWNWWQILHNIPWQEITLIKTNGEELTIMDRNLWATAYRWESWASAADTYWNLYQWWNNYWFPNSWTVTTSNVQVDASWYSWQNPINSSTFICWNTNWMNPSNGELWWKTEWTEVSRQGPCPNGWHVPSKAEMDRLLSMYQSITWIPSTWWYVKFEQYLLFTYPWYRRHTDWTVATQWQSYNWAHLLTNDINQQLYYWSSWWYYNAYNNACWNPIRPFKNVTNN